MFEKLIWFYFRSNKFNTGDAEKQKIIKTLLGENDELRVGVLHVEYAKFHRSVSNN